MLKLSYFCFLLVLCGREAMTQVTVTTNIGQAVNATLQNSPNYFPDCAFTTCSAVHSTHFCKFLSSSGNSHLVLQQFLAGYLQCFTGTTGSCGIQFRPLTINNNLTLSVSGQTSTGKFVCNLDNSQPLTIGGFGSIFKGVSQDPNAVQPTFYVNMSLDITGYITLYSCQQMVDKPSTERRSLATILSSLPQTLSASQTQTSTVTPTVTPTVTLTVTPTVAPTITPAIVPNITYSNLFIRIISFKTEPTIKLVFNRDNNTLTSASVVPTPAASLIPRMIHGNASEEIKQQMAQWLESKDVLEAVSDTVFDNTVAFLSNLLQGFLKTCPKVS